MNWYVLQIQMVHAKSLCSFLNRNSLVHAFVPYMEVYLLKEERLDLRPLFPGYMFVWSDLTQIEFDSFLRNLDEGKKGLVRELKEANVSALREEEIELLENLLDEDHILRMSYGQLFGKQSIPYSGPLVKYSNNIKKVDFHRNMAFLNLNFFDREIGAGFLVKRNNK